MVRNGFVAGKYVISALVLLMLIKSVIWAVALGSGTSGGVLAPLLIIGGCVGALESSFLAGGDKALWPLVGMAAVMGGTMRSPLTGILFALELTYDVRLLLPLLVGSVIAHAFTVLVMKRSILTEKVARRGYHISREYSVDPLERLMISDAMSAPVVTIPASLPVRQLMHQYFLNSSATRHQAYPVLDANGDLLGIVTKANLVEEWLQVLTSGGTESDFGAIITYDLLNGEPITAYPWESCRTAAERMAQHEIGRPLVVSPEDPKILVGLLTRSDLLKARNQHVDEESRREQFLAVYPRTQPHPLSKRQG
jgi:CBS domain-containing protein